MATGHRDISAGYIGNPLIHTYNYSFSVCKVHQNRQWYIFLYVCSMSLKIASFTLWLSENSWYTGVIYENVSYVRTCLLYRWIKGTCIGLVSINIIQNKSQGGGGGGDVPQKLEVLISVISPLFSGSLCGCNSACCEQDWGAPQVLGYWIRLLGSDGVDWLWVSTFWQKWIYWFNKKKMDWLLNLMDVTLITCWWIN